MNNGEQRVVLIDQRGAMIFGLNALMLYIMMFFASILTFFTAFPIGVLIFFTRHSLSRFWWKCEGVLGLMIPLSLASCFLHLAVYEHSLFSMWKYGPLLSIWVTLFLLAEVWTVFLMALSRGWSRLATAGAVVVALAMYVAFITFQTYPAFRPLAILTGLPSSFGKWSFSIGLAGLTQVADFFVTAFTGNHLGLSQGAGDLTNALFHADKSIFQSRWLGWWVLGSGYLLACWLFFVIRMWIRKIVE